MSVFCVGSSVAIPTHSYTQINSKPPTYPFNPSSFAFSDRCVCVLCRISSRILVPRHQLTTIRHVCARTFSPSHAFALHCVHNLHASTATLIALQTYTPYTNIPIYETLARHRPPAPSPRSKGTPFAIHTRAHMRPSTGIKLVYVCAWALESAILSLHIHIPHTRYDANERPNDRTPAPHHTYDRQNGRFATTRSHKRTPDVNCVHIHKCICCT